MRLSRLGTEEFETILELIAEIMFMIVGIVFVTMSIRNLSNRSSALQRVDKIQVNGIYIQDSVDFTYTGYQTYMFFKLLDGLSQEDLIIVNNDPTWYGAHNYLNTQARDNDDPNCCVATIEPSIQKLNFMTYKNMRLSGSAAGRHRSVIEVLFHTGEELYGSAVPVGDYEVDRNAQDAVVAIYRGIKYMGNDPPRFKLELTANHCGDNNDVTSADGLNVYEYRKIRKWTLHSCYH